MSSCTTCNSNPRYINACRANHLFCDDCAVVIVIGGANPTINTFCPVCSAAAPPPLPSFVCPITRDVMRDPVILEDGHSYERDAITKWLSIKAVSPNTNKDVDPTVIIPNHLLRTLIREWFLIGGARE